MIGADGAVWEELVKFLSRYKDEGRDTIKIQNSK